MKKLFVIVLVLICGMAFGQEKPRLGILPFSGGPSGHAETITTLLAYQSDFTGAFTPVPVTNAVTAEVLERTFQLTEWIDADTAARLGRLMNADFVISGQIRSAGARNLVIVSLFNVNTFELLAGVCREYRGLDGLPGILPEITQALIGASRKDTSALPRLSVALPFIAAETGRREAESLLQILALELANTGRFAVLPRLETAGAVAEELESRGAFTAADEAKALDRAVNARFMLKTEITREGTANMIRASVFDANDGSLLSGGRRNYYAMSDGYYVMTDLARLIAGAPVVPVVPRMPAEIPVQPPPVVVEEPPPAALEPAPPPPVVRAEPPVEPPEPAPVAETRPPAPPPVVEEEAPVRFTRDNARLWTVGVSAGTSFAIPWLIATAHATIAPLRYSFIEIGLDAGLLSGTADVDYYSLYPYAHLALFVPFAGKGGFYIGAGGGYMMSFYTFPEGDIGKETFALDAVAGFNVLNFLDISYTFRTNFTRVNHKISVGYTYRF